MKNIHPVLQLEPIVHPYLLADNRHYTFYLFKILLRLKWLMIPVYAGGIMFIIFQLPQSVLLQTAYFVCTAATIGLAFFSNDMKLTSFR